ncbi:MAG: DUF4402 domain-containing protein [Alphaproteobacteria bacterium]|nr:DUF4402 domain-containing protein [Alphaproteobacteria bacterium]MBN2779463.1 DUF4402 domain-containing protein [Alphaproteobacteria bacterium]
MKKLFFIFTLLVSSNSFAATGSGHAQAELSTPLSISNSVQLNFGTIAIDPGSGGQVLWIGISDNIACPATYVCTGSPQTGHLIIQGAPSSLVNVSVVSNAVLSDGNGNTLIFVPNIGGGTEKTLSESGSLDIAYNGTISFTGSEVIGTYSSSNAGGSGFQVTAIY